MIAESTGIIQMISGAGLIVKLVMLILLFFSITSWAIIFIKYRYIRNAFRESLVFSESFWSSRNLAEAFANAKQLSSSPVANIFRTGYQELKKFSRVPGIPESKPSANAVSLGAQFEGISNIKRALRRSSNTEITKMTQLVPFLATAGSTAPFIGLFGTVWGIMSSFHSIGLTGSASLAVVAPGISEALVATAAGLAVAIPSVIGYNFFMQKIRIIDTEMQSFSADFLNIVERDILRSKGNS
ncbi:MAG: protein TolQ [Proteobacteria bacterium]|nr:protein TolQ [Pseudomonadota bacterium]